MNLSDGLWTNPDYKGAGPDYPAWRWKFVEPMLPDVRGKRCLDIGCSSGFFSLKLKEIGANYVLGIDHGEIMAMILILKVVIAVVNCKNKYLMKLKLSMV
jgi:predicted rRNA methylase YqxC with S4 and FtsJ domains